MPPIERLKDIMARLRDPENGCPWDVEQDFSSIAPHTIEEAYEVADAIAENNMEELKSELGDLLFQVIFYAQMAKEEGLFDFDEVAQTIADKMVKRHPHVFGDADIKTAEEQTDAWERQKEEERKAKNEKVSILDGVTKGLPALSRAVKLQKRAARVGFDWPDVEPVLEKVEEELGELKAEFSAHSQQNSAAIEEEFGDLMFVMANLARHLSIDPETALLKANAKFEKRFRHIEQALQRKQKDINKTSLEEMERYWQEAKHNV